MAGKGKKEKAIGIDLGTTYSCVGVWQNDRVEIVVNELGNRITPSIVAFTDNERLVGDDAKFQSSSNLLNTVFDVKRLIGRLFTDSSVQTDIKLWPFTVVSGQHEKPMVEVSYKGVKKLFPPEEISSMILTKMKTSAEHFLETQVKNAIITVPAYFSDSQRQMTKDAGQIAGLNVMRIINEPTAAAMAYGFGRDLQQTKRILVFDLGGGTFDVSVVLLHNSKFEVKAVGGEPHLGGEDFDNRMLAYCGQQFNTRYKTDLFVSSKALRRLRSECERAKRTLSSVVETVIDIDALYEGHDFFLKIRRAKFEELNVELFEKCIEVVKKCMQDAKLSKSEIDDIILVGGSSRIPKVQEMVRDYFNGKELCKAVNPDEAVANGAALAAAEMNKENVQRVIVDVTPLTLGISLNDDVLMKIVVPRNTPLPTRKETFVTTAYNDQEEVRFSVHEGESLKVSENNLLSEFALSGISRVQSGMLRIKVCFEVDEEGILKVFAHDEGSGASKEIVITNDGERLSTEEIRKMIADAENFRLDEEKAKEKQVATNELQCQVSNIRKMTTNAKGEGRMPSIISNHVGFLNHAVSNALKIPLNIPSFLFNGLTKSLDSCKNKNLVPHHVGLPSRVYKFWKERHADADVVHNIDARDGDIKSSDIDGDSEGRDTPYVTPLSEYNAETKEFKVIKSEPGSSKKKRVPDDCSSEGGSSLRTLEFDSGPADRKGNGTHKEYTKGQLELDLEVHIKDIKSIQRAQVVMEGRLNNLLKAAENLKASVKKEA